MRRLFASAIVLVTAILHTGCSSSDGLGKGKSAQKGDASAGTGGDAVFPDGAGGSSPSGNGGTPGAEAGGGGSLGGVVGSGGAVSGTGSAASSAGGAVSAARDAGATDAGHGACTGDGDCAAPTRFCDVADGRCVTCLSDKHCPTGQSCSATDHSCKFACQTSGDCADPQPYCDTAHKECVACLSDTNCATGAKKTCDPKSRTCVECLNNDDCSCLLLGQAPCCTAANRCVCGLLVCL
jgi:Cys-rich repeat protein